MRHNRRSPNISLMKCFVASVLFLTCLIAGCADNSEQGREGLPPPVRTSTTPYPTSATRMDVVCRQPDAMKTNVCEAYRYGNFGGSH